MSKGVGSQYRAIIPPVATPWIAFPYSANYQAFNAGYSTPGYRRIGDIVYLRGLITRNTSTAGANSTCGTLPAGFQPPGLCLYEQHLSGVRVRVDVYGVGGPTPAGAIVHADVALAVGGYLSLDGIFFSVAA